MNSDSPALCDRPRLLHHHNCFLPAALSRPFFENGAFKFFTFRVVLFHLWRIVNLRRHEIVIYVIDTTYCVIAYNLATCFDQLYCRPEDASAPKIAIANFIPRPEWDVTVLSKLYIRCTYFVDLAVKMYESYCLKMAVWGPKHVGVTVLVMWHE